MLGFFHDTDVTQLSDEELLALSLKNPSHFGILVDRYQEPFLRRAQRIVGGKEEAEDVVQEVFTRIFVHAGKFTVQEGASFRSWAYKVLMNTTFSHYQRLKKKRGEVQVIDPEVFEFLPETAKGPEEDELKDYVASNLSRIAPDLARAMDLHFLQEYSHKEIAEMEHTSVSAIKTRIYRAKRELRKLIHPENGRAENNLL